MKQKKFDQKCLQFTCCQFGYHINLQNSVIHETKTENNFIVKCQCLFFRMRSIKVSYSHLLLALYINALNLESNLLSTDWIGLNLEMLRG
jgi:hypothetical protein